MSDQATVEKVEALYSRQIDRLEKQLAEERAERHREREMLRSEYQERLKQSIQEYDERRDDLIAQNDGMLGAIGRLHTENLALKEKIAAMDFKIRNFEVEMTRIQVEAEKCQEEAEERINALKDEFNEQTNIHKRQLEEMKAKNKRKS